MSEEMIDMSIERDEDVSDDYAEQLARDIMVIFQKQMDPDAAAADASAYIFENTGTPERAPYFVDATEMLLEAGSAGDKFAAMSWAGLVSQSVNNKDYDTYLHLMADSILRGYYKLDKPDIELKEKKFSGFAGIIARTFIRMVELNSSLGDTAAEIFTILVRNEMALEARAQAIEKETGESPIPTNMQKVYDETLEYLSTRAEFKASAMGGDAENPYEHVSVLCERLRGSRRYVMQEVMNERALEKKKQLEMELENQLASAEEIVMATAPFTDGIALFVQEKRYNYKFLAVEKIRMTLQLLGSIIGAIYFLIGYMGMGGVHWIDGIVVCLGMIIFTRMAGSRKRFQYFYPADVSKELEACSTTFINVMRHMSQEQLEHFLVRQIRNDRNQKYLTMVPEFVKYLYAIMPDRKNMIITVDELSELVENTEIEVAKQMRGQ